MTTLENRPNTALIVIDVQNGVVGGTHERDAVVANVGNLVEKARRGGRSGCLGPALERRACEGQRRVADRPRAEPGRSGAARREELRRLLRGHEPRDSAVGPRRRAARRRRRADRRVHPLDAARRHRPRLRRDPRQRRTHDGGPVGVGRAAAGQGDRAHEPVLDVPRSAGAQRPGRSRRRTSTSAERPVQAGVRGP